MNSWQPLAASNWRKVAAFALLSIVASACQARAAEPAPILLKPADTPAALTVGHQEEELPASPSVPRAPAVGTPFDSVVSVDTGQVEIPTSTPWPTVAGTGLPPNQAQLFRPPETGLDSPVDWRPPPLPAPLALDPDDHYWLSRPIPSDRRNYDLEWYPYGNQPHLASALPYRIHHGLDFPNEPGTPIFAAASGTVIWAGPLASARNGVTYYGNTIIIEHNWDWLGQSVYSLYAHTLELFVEVGDFVEQGQLLAGVGATGEVSGPHLHLEVRVGANNYGSTRNPALWVVPYEGWGTLAGRFLDSRGRLISGARITIIPREVESTFSVPRRTTYTYDFNSGVRSDDVWQENFVVGDLPAGLYTVRLEIVGEVFQRTIRVFPGRTNFMVVQADFPFFPTATPLPTLEPSPTSDSSDAIQTPTPSPGGQ